MHIYFIYTFTCNAVDDLVPVASKPASAAPKVKATAADPFVEGLSKGMRELDGGKSIAPRTSASPAAAAKNADALADVLDATAPVSRQPVIKPADLVKAKYTRNAAGEIVPVEPIRPAKSTDMQDAESFLSGLDEGMKDLPEVKEARPEGIDFAAEEGKPRSDVEINNADDVSQVSELDTALTHTRYDLAQLKSTDNFNDTAIDHIFLGNENHASGYHYEGVPGAKGNVVPGTETMPNSFGVYEADVEIGSRPKSGNGGKSSFFPKDWLPQQVVDAVNEAYVSRQHFAGNIFIGYTTDGMKIQMYIDPNRKIISAFPIY